MSARKDEQFDDTAHIRASRRELAQGTKPQARSPRNLERRDDASRKDFYSDEHPETGTR